MELREDSQIKSLSSYALPLFKIDYLVASCPDPLICVPQDPDLPLRVMRIMVSTDVYVPLGPGTQVRYAWSRNHLSIALSNAPLLLCHVGRRWSSTEPRPQPTECRSWMTIRGGTNAQPARGPSKGVSTADATNGGVSNSITAHNAHCPPG